jgi:hypothetical protein
MGEDTIIWLITLKRVTVLIQEGSPWVSGPSPKAGSCVSHLVMIEAFSSVSTCMRHAVKTLRYRPEDRGFDTR